jgi:hypothetical protein
MVSVSPSAATSGQISTLASESTASAYETALAADAPPSENWEMSDTGLSPYTGTVDSSSGTTTPCAHVEVTVQQVQGGSTTCAVPSGGSSCPAPAGTTLLTSLSTAATTDVPITTSSVSLTVKCALTATSPAGVAGLHVLPDLTFGITRPGSWNATLAYAGASVEL